MSEAELFDVVRTPVITEKATFVSETGQYVFTVAPTATKEAIRRAVEEIFKVSVISVQTLNQKGKVKRTKGRLGARSDVKKAYVRLAPGAQIDLTAKIG
ncbi:50S ribosomal protein L23 [Acetobacteraceae bacterium]|nr:50S ribosomal protein L23 [Acetobacteraceae bacterium]